VHAYLDGQSAESIAQSFPALTLEQAYGALTYYLAHRTEVDASIAAARIAFEALRQGSRDRDPMFVQKLSNARSAEKLSRP
jgi:hypothetical protein